MAIQLNGDTATRLQAGMQVGSAIELPFFTPRFWALNGDARLASLGGAMHFGGWACSADDMEQAAESWGIAEIPNTFQVGEMVTADGRNLSIFTTRALIVAPIASRTTWSLADGTRLTAYTQGARQHVQVIALLAEKQESTYYPLGPIMLTAKGYQAKNILDSFQTWERATKQVRGKIAPGVPAWCFYLALGTFGNQRKQVMVGKRSQSPITPITAFVPREITPELIEKLFVGQDGAEMMVSYLEDAQEWLHAYDTASNGKGEANNGVPFEEPPFFDEPPQEDVFMP